MDSLEVGNVQKRVGLLELPAELRLGIYRHLLHADYVYKASPFPKMKLDTAILGVCRQARAEASKVLYDENQWIIFTGNWIGGDYGEYMQGCGLPILCTGAARHIQDVALRIDMRLKRETGNTDTLETTALAYSEESLDELCRTFWLDALRCEVDITVSLTQYSDRPRSVRQEQLLAPLAQVRGVRKADIEGVSSRAQAEALQKVMEDGDWTWPQVMGRLTADKEEGNVRFKLGSYLKAEISYLRALVFKDQATDHIIPQHQLDEDVPCLNRFAATVCDIFNNHSLVAFKLGKFDCAIRSTNDALRYPSISDKARARAHYRRGLGHVGLHRDIEAAKDFYYAHRLLPMDDIIKQQLESVESRIGKKITEKMAPIAIVTFNDRSIPDWHGDPRVIQDWSPFGIAQLEMCRRSQ